MSFDIIEVFVMPGIGMIIGFMLAELFLALLYRFEDDPLNE